MSGLDAKKGAVYDGIPPRFYKKLAHDLAAPLKSIFNASLASGIFPSHWKKANVAPVHKSSLRSRIENYLQISLHSCPAKILDLLMCQSVRKSTTTNLALFVSNIMDCLELGHIERYLASTDRLFWVT